VTWSPNFSSTRANKEEENFQHDPRSRLLILILTQQRETRGGRKERPEESKVQDRMKGGEGGGAGCSFFFCHII